MKTIREIKKSIPQDHPIGDDIELLLHVGATLRLVPIARMRANEIDEVVLLEERIKGLCVKIIDRINSEGVKP